MSNHVFISHSSKDAGLAEALLRALEEMGLTCWIAPRDVPLGGSYAEAILTAIKGARALVLVYTEQSNISQHVLREIERAVKHRIDIIPVRFDDSTVSPSLSYLLATIQWVSATSTPLQSTIKRVADQIAHNLGLADNTKSNANSPRPAHWRNKYLRSTLILISLVCAVVTAKILHQPGTIRDPDKTPLKPTPLPESLVVSLDKETYREGETMNLSISVPRPGYLRVYSIAADGSAVQIFPNRFASDNFVAERRSVAIPNKDATYTLKTSLPPGYSVGTESVLAILAEEQFHDSEIDAFTGEPFPNLGKITASELRTRGIVIVDKRTESTQAVTHAEEHATAKANPSRSVLSATASYGVSK